MDILLLVSAAISLISLVCFFVITYNILKLRRRADHIDACVTKYAIAHGHIKKIKCRLCPQEINVVEGIETYVDCPKCETRNYFPEPNTEQ